MRIYVAGPYSADSPEGVESNVRRAIEVAAALFARGHEAFCPHAATHQVHQACPMPYEVWMAFDLGILERWAEAIFVIEESPGVRRELERAMALGLPVFRDLAHMEPRS